MGRLGYITAYTQSISGVRSHRRYTSFAAVDHRVHGQRVCRTHTGTVLRASCDLRHRLRVKAVSTCASARVPVQPLLWSSKLRYVSALPLAAGRCRVPTLPVPGLRPRRRLQLYRNPDLRHAYLRHSTELNPQFFRQPCAHPVRLPPSHRLCSTRHRSLSDAASARRSYASSDVVAPFHRALVPHARIHSTRAYAPTVLCRSTVHSSVSFSRLRLRESVIVPHARQSESLSTYSCLYFYSPLRFLPCSRLLSIPIYVCPSVSMLTIALGSCTPCVTHPSYILYATRI